MYTNIALTLAPLLYLARADVSLDRDDIPRACDAICDPIVELTRKCDTDLRGDQDRVEDRLEAQCVCTNDSFDVGRIAALCADCIRQNWRDDDDDDDQRDHMEDIDDILYTCGFSSTSYVASSASGIVASITVDATRPTDSSQLTTTITGGTAARGTDSAATATSNNNDNSDDNSDDNSASATNDSSSPDETNAAAGLAPYGVGAAVVGAALMLA